MGYQVMNKIEMEPSGLSETYFHTMMRLMGEIVISWSWKLT